MTLDLDRFGAVQITARQQRHPLFPPMNDAPEGVRVRLGQTRELFGRLIDAYELRDPDGRWSFKADPAWIDVVPARKPLSSPVNPAC